MQGNIEQQAPGQIITHGKVVYTEILIRAGADRVWAVLTDFKAYPQWNPFIKSLKGDPVVGGRIEVFIQPPGQSGMNFKPRVLAFEAGRVFRWLGSFGLPRIFDGEHSFVLEDQGDGTVLLRHYERFRGILVPFMHNMLDGATRRGFEAMNEQVKALAEKV